MRRSVALLGLLLSARAFGHGATPSPVTFTAPPRLTATVSDAGDRVFEPYAWATADASYDVTFTDGDSDPIAHYDFYYLPFAPPAAYTVDQIRSLATPIAGVAGGLWNACTCPTPDFGGTCPDAGTRPCANDFTWDTSQLAPGAYWPIAVADDPPFDLFTISDGPLIVSHGGPPPPAAIIVQPDGFGTFDETYTVRWLMTGTAPFHVDLAYVSDDDLAAGKGFQPIGSDVAYTQESDGSYDYAWDVSQLAAGHVYYVKLTVTDANASTYTESPAALTVAHPGDHPDMAIASIDDHHHGCDTAPARGAFGFVGLLVASALGAALTLLLARRRS